MKATANLQCQFSVVKVKHTLVQLANKDADVSQSYLMLP